MLWNILFSIIFAISVYYLLKNRLNIRKAADVVDEAVFPTNKEEYSQILIPAEWKEMKPLSKNTKSYQYVKWGTVVALILITAILLLVLNTDFLGSSFFSLAYLFFVLINAIRHQGNFYILSKGLILNGKYYPFSQVKRFEIEKVVRWHELYGLNDRVNNAYKLSFNMKKVCIQPSYVVIEDQEMLEKISSLLKEKGISSEKL